MAFIHLENLCRQYGTHQALKQVNLTLQPGRIGLLGPNGAGKSTLLKILLGLLAPSSGSGEVLGHRLVPEQSESAQNPLSRWWAGVRAGLFGSDLLLRREFGYMPEADALVPGLTGAEYVTLAGELYGMPKLQAARRAHEVLTYLELEEARYRKLEAYSTGMKQRIKLAQALVHDPPVLLLDEPTSGLDPTGRDAMLRLLLNLGTEQKKSIILCTHLLQDVERVCDAVVILYKGEVLRSGSVAELRRQRHDRYRLQIQGQAQEYLADLALEGVQMIADNSRGEGRGEFIVEVPTGWATRTFFLLAEHHSVLVRGLQRDEEDLETLFHRVLAEKASA